MWVIQSIMLTGYTGRRPGRALCVQILDIQPDQPGDCRIFPGAVLSLYANGSMNWKCDIKGTDSGDE